MKIQIFKTAEMGQLPRMTLKTKYHSHKGQKQK